MPSDKSLLEQVRQNRLEWKDGLIGKGEIMLMERYPVPKLYARGLMTTLNSLAIRNLRLTDKMGEVRPNVWISYIAQSGIGIKTPPLKRKRKLVQKYYKALLAPAKFTPEGFTEWAVGKEADKEGKRKPVPPHEAGIIIRDEGSRLLGEIKNSPHLAQMKEYLSDLWDGYIESYYTRAFQYEGNVEIFISLDLVSSPHFYSVLDESFFVQGTGNRILWVTEEKHKPERLSEDFFNSYGQKDKQWDDFEDETFGRLTHFEKDIGDIGGIEKEANKLWREFKYECDMTVYKSDGYDNFAIYLTKQPLNALKLAMNYAASVNSIDDFGMLWILKEDMETAIADVRGYIECWRKVVSEWREWTVRHKDEGQNPLQKRKYELQEFVKQALMSPDKMTSVAELSASLECPDINKIKEILDMGVNKGWFKRHDNEERLTSEQQSRFKPPRGFFPKVYQVTERGEKAVNEEV